jgi:AraC-like DNA-binding protein
MDAAGVPAGDAALHVGERIALGAFETQRPPGAAPVSHRIGAFSLSFHLTATRKQWGLGRTSVVGPNWVAFNDVGDEYRSQALGADGLRCAWFAMPAGVAQALIDEWAPRLSTRAGLRVFPFAHAPVDAATVMRHRLLQRYAAHTPRPDPLLIEEIALDIAGQALRALATSLERTTRSIARPRCERRRIEIVEAVKGLLEREYWRNFTLAEVAAHVHTSPFHLARLFRRQTGSSLREYHLRMRLGRALERLEWPGIEVSAVAMELGFASHSHLSDAFRRQFGISPSGYARTHNVEMAMKKALVGG